MIKKIRATDEVLTGWTDTAESLIRAAHEAAFCQHTKYYGVEGDAGKIESDSFGWYTEDKAIADKAIEIGYQIEQEDMFSETIYRFAF